MKPKCCEKCKRKAKEDCAYFRNCVRWHEWFRKEWAEIRAAAARLKEEENA